MESDAQQATCCAGMQAHSPKQQQLEEECASLRMQVSQLRGQLDSRRSSGINTVPIPGTLQFIFQHLSLCNELQHAPLSLSGLPAPLQRLARRMPQPASLILQICQNSNAAAAGCNAD